VAKRQKAAAIAEEHDEPAPDHVYRVCQEGVYHVRGMMSKQKLNCNKTQFIHLLQNGCTRFEDVEESGDAEQLALLEQIKPCHDGCVVAVCTLDDDPNVCPFPTDLLIHAMRAIATSTVQQDTHLPLPLRP
jgi:hypothetical protein